MSNYSWFLNADVSEFEGKWIAILDERVVASSEHLKSIMEEVKTKYAQEKVSLVKIPSSKEAIFSDLTSFERR